MESLAKAGKSLNHAIVLLLQLREQYSSKDVLSAVETAIKYKSYGDDYVENILHQKRHSKVCYPKIFLKNSSLNHMQWLEPVLLFSDAIILKNEKKIMTKIDETVDKLRQLRLNNMADNQAEAIEKEKGQNNCLPALFEKSTTKHWKCIGF